MEKLYIGEFKSTGPIEINVDFLIKKWNHLYMITEWKSDDSWRLIKYHRIDSPITDVKITISPEKAKEIIDKLNLVALNSGLRSGYTWRRKEDFEYLENWRMKKYK